MPDFTRNVQYSEKSLNELEQLVKSGLHFSYFQSNIVELYKNIGNVKMSISRLGQKLGVKLSQKKVSDNPDHYQTVGLSQIAIIEREFQEIYEEILCMQENLDNLFEYDCRME